MITYWKIILFPVPKFQKIIFFFFIICFGGNKMSRSSFSSKPHPPSTLTVEYGPIMKKKINDLNWLCFCLAVFRFLTGRVTRADEKKIMILIDSRADDGI